MHVKEAQKSLKKAADLGFDWPSLQGLIDQIIQEVDEVKEEHHSPNQDREKLVEECGDLILAVIDLMRKLDVDADHALKIGHEKFNRRFDEMLVLAKDQSIQFSTLTLDQMLILWDKVKQKERAT